MNLHITENNQLKKFIPAHSIAYFEVIENGIRVKFVFNFQEVQAFVIGNSAKKLIHSLSLNAESAQIASCEYLSEREYRDIKQKSDRPIGFLEASDLLSFS